MEVETRKVDPQGRISLPKKWCKQVLRENDRVCVISLPDRVEILPSDADLDRYLNLVEVDVKEGGYIDYHEFRKQLRRLT